MDKNTARRLLVLVTTIFTIFINFLANYLPLNGYSTGEISDLIPTYFRPAGYVFSIWGLIYLGLIAYAVYQSFAKVDQRKYIQQASYYVIAVNILNMAWIVLWHYQRIALSAVVMLAILACLVKIYSILNQTQKKTIEEKVLVTLPFSIYLSRISVATIANIAAALFVMGYEKSFLGIGAEIWTAILILVAAALAVYFVTIKRDYVFMLVIAWAVTGIAINFYDMALITNTVLIVLGLFIGTTAVDLSQKYKQK